MILNYAARYGVARAALGAFGQYAPSYCLEIFLYESSNARLRCEVIAVADGMMNATQAKPH